MMQRVFLPLLTGLVTGLVTALAFLTRLAPGRERTEEELAASVPLYPAVGGILGLLLTAPFFFGLAAGHAWVQAWLFLAASLYLTRGLHWDGLADLIDAWGGAADSERFWEILKDSRMGAFGGIGLFLGLAGQLILLQTAFSRSDWGLLIWAPLLGRAMILPLAAFSDVHPRSSLGRLIRPGASGKAALLSLLLAVLAGLLLAGPATALRGLGMATLVVLVLNRLAARHGGLNGDFLGSAVVCAELAALLSGVL